MLEPLTPARATIMTKFIFFWVGWWRLTGKRERNKQDKLRRIKAAARGLFIEHGFHDTTTRQIAEHAGIATGTVFLYAGDKREILLLLHIDGFKAAATTALRNIDQRLPLIDQIMSVCSSMLSFYRLSPSLSVIALQESYCPGPGDVRRENREMVTHFIHELANVIRANGHHNRHADPPMIVANTIFALFQAAAQSLVNGLTNDYASQVHSLRRAVSLVLD